jgi:hypothetical protein
MEQNTCKVLKLKVWQAALAVALLVVAAAGLWAGFGRYKPSSAWAERSAIPWGLMVPSYAFFASSAAGLAIIGSLLLLWRGGNGSAALAARHMYTLSFSLLIPAWIIVFLDLGRPDHAMWLVKGWHSTSRIAWMPVFYALLALPMLALLVALIRVKASDALWAKLLALLTLAAGLGLEFNLGQVFGSAVGLPGLAGARLGLLYAVTAVALGAGWSALLLPWIIGGRDGDVEASRLSWLSGAIGVAAGMTVAGFAAAWFLAYGSVSEPARAVANELTSGGHAALFYGVEVALGYILAPLIALYALKASSPAAAAAGLLALIAGFTEKYGLIIAAEEARLKSAIIFGGDINPYSLLYGSLHYHIEASEALAVLGAAALGFLVFLLAELLLALGAAEKPRLLIFRG